MTKEFADTSQFFSANVVFINELYQKFLQNPDSIDKSWADFFADNEDEVKSILSDYQGPSWSKRKLKVVGSEEYDISSNVKKDPTKDPTKDVKKSTKSDLGKDLEVRVANLITAYKRFGHLNANLDPLNLTNHPFVPELDPQYHGIESSDLDKEIDLKGGLNLGRARISKIIENLKFVYTNTIGSQFEYINNNEQRKWLSKETESSFLFKLPKEEKVKVLKEVIRTEKFEQFLHKRFPGAKRFSIEGGDSSISAVEKIIDTSAKNGVKKVIIGMAHRGRLNTLTGIMSKPYHQMIAEFKGTPGIPEDVSRLGDVKYHMGYSSTREIDGNEIALSLAFNPSHLEAVNAVVTGKVRATQDLNNDNSRKSALAVLIHGDAAFAGQGVVAEGLVLDTVAGYETGGVVHIIVNNQIGFTANPTESRGTNYASDLSKAIDAPIFHVNGDDVESVVKVADIATRYRQKFKRDVVIDVICYRKYGHNEGDEPMYTQPVMYTKIKQHPSLEKIYSGQLISEGVISEDEHKKLLSDFESHLSSEFDKAENYKAKKADWLKGEWENIKDDGDNGVIPKTSVSQDTLKNLISKVIEVPEGFNANPKIVRQMEARKKAVDSGTGIDWGCAESLAFASLLSENNPIRITGQDSGRGTFSHRHSILHDAKTGQRHNIFSTINNNADFEIHDSVLSEYGVLGFEYGYSLGAPNSLTVWEAQFGDFANGAQIVFDQFITSSEAKWLRKSGLVMLLPHGYEGQGPEHSSARLERHLQSCADNNLRVVNITKPANFFHALRRQIHSKDRKPLVVMSPKSLLRHKLAVSDLSEFSDFDFRPLLPEVSKIKDDKKVKKLVLCSGKVYYDLFEARESKKIEDVALVRLEQLYPFPKAELKEELKKYKNAEVIWCQEEPKNMGSWKFVEDLIEEALVESKHKFLRPKYVGRIASCSPATGYMSYHIQEQTALIDEALR